MSVLRRGRRLDHLISGAGPIEQVLSLRSSLSIFCGWISAVEGVDRAQKLELHFYKWLLKQRISGPA